MSFSKDFEMFSKCSELIKYWKLKYLPKDIYDYDSKDNFPVLTSRMKIVFFSILISWLLP